VVGGSLKPTADQTQGLRDLTGDGIPDYFDHGRVWIGTGTGFQPPIDVVSSGANFQFSHQTETCNGDISSTDGGLYDIDGDGKPEVIGLGGSTIIVSQLVGGSMPGVPEAGRLIGIDNGQGAKTSISYVSAKQFTSNALPFPEVVVSLVATTGAYGLGGSIAGYSYAYGKGALVFNSAADRFVFPGYRRRVVVQLLDALPDGPANPGRLVQGVATITDAWPLEPFQVSMTKQQRWLRNQVVGRVSDIFKLRAIFDPNPWALLGLQADDPRLIGANHYEYDAKFYELPLDPAEDVFNCFEMVAPLDFQATLAALTSDTLDVCRAHGFAFQISNFSWFGDAAPPLSDQNIQTRAQTLAVDDFGRPLVMEHENDIFRSDDDFCVESTYAPPVAAFPRVLNALSSRRVYACGKGSNDITVASESWVYDNRSDGAVSDGHITSHSVDKRATDTGALLNTIHDFDASYDGNGNISTLRSQRDAAIRTTSIAYDPFGIVPVQTTIDGTALPSSSVTFGYDPVSLLPLSTTDANSTQRGTEYDGFGRPVRSTVTLAGDALGVVSTTSYLGDGGGDPAGRRITVTRFTDPVAPANVATARGRSGTMFLDELGRQRRTEVSLGADYSAATLTLGSRLYDPAVEWHSSPIHFPEHRIRQAPTVPATTTRAPVIWIAWSVAMDIRLCPLRRPIPLWSGFRGAFSDHSPVMWTRWMRATPAHCSRGRRNRA
jgi:YD repeat-containing protein